MRHSVECLSNQISSASPGKRRLIHSPKLDREEEAGAHVSRPQLILVSDETRLNYRVLAHLLASCNHKLQRPYYGLWAGFTYVCACVCFHCGISEHIWFTYGR